MGIVREYFDSVRIDDLKMERMMEEIYDARPELKKWNEVQKDIWLILVSWNLVDRNDPVIFIKFADFFRTYYVEYDHPPTPKEVKFALDL